MNVVTWLWGRGKFTAAHVNTLARMVARHYAKPHRFICVTNEGAGLDPSVEVVPDAMDFAKVPSPHGGSNPSCYRRLRMLGPFAATVFGDRFASLDLDAVVLRDLAPLWDRDEPFVGWRDPMHPKQFNGSMMLIRAGACRQVWDTFDPATSPQTAVRAGCVGSDQGWISYKLAGAPAWTAADGVCSYKVDVLKHKRPPANARIVFFHGRPKPWDLPNVGWIHEHYR